MTDLPLLVTPTYPFPTFPLAVSLFKCYRKSYKMSTRGFTEPLEGQSHKHFAKAICLHFLVKRNVNSGHRKRTASKADFVCSTTAAKVINASLHKFAAPSTA